MNVTALSALMRCLPRLFFPCCLAFLLCLSSAAWGKVLLFQDFSIDLPSGWRVVQDGNTAAFIALDKSATMQVTVERLSSMPKEGMSAKELAEAYAEEFKGSPPVMEDNDPNYYSFSFKAPDGQDAEASIVVSGSLFYIISISGKHDDLAGMVASVLLSIQ